MLLSESGAVPIRNPGDDAFPVPDPPVKGGFEVEAVEEEAFPVPDPPVQGGE